MLSPFENANLMVVVAHPDDEVLFAGAQLAHTASLTVVHVTDGAPSAAVARRRGFSDRTMYARARQQEFRTALGVAGVSARHEMLGLKDGLACLWIDVGVRRLIELIDTLSPDLILTHAYDGGHRDHDTVSALVQLSVRRSNHRPEIWEFGGYFVDHDSICHYCFPSQSDAAKIVYKLSHQEKHIKSRMLSCFRSQKHVVDLFSRDLEVFRPAPSYDFSKPPLTGRLGYEVTNAGIESTFWRILVRLHMEALVGHRRFQLRLALVKFGMRALVASTRLRARHPRVAGRISRLYLTTLATFCPLPLQESAPRLDQTDRRA